MRNGILYLFLSFVFLSCSKKSVGSLDLHSNRLLFDSIKVVTIDQGPKAIGPCEPSISINPINSNHIVAGSVLDNVYVSYDGGENWVIDKLKSTHGVYGDPVVRFNNEGFALYAHLSNSAGKAYKSMEFLDRIVVHQSRDGGHTWNDGNFPKVDHTKDQDKEWMTVAPHGTILMSWTEFDKYGSKDTIDKSRILFSKSVDGGITWSDGFAISELSGDCLDGDNTTEGAHPCVGIDGTYYVAWSYNGKIYLDISKDMGQSWMNKDKIVANQIGGWTFDVPGVGRCNGMPVMDCDYSNGPNKGRLYISYSDQTNGENDTDVWLIYSDDKGETWSEPTRVNDDGRGKHQFFSWMDIDQSNGNLYFVFYDRRNYEDTSTDVYLAYSNDGGRQFHNMRISEKPFIPDGKVFFGDYNDISAAKGRIRPIWTRQDGKILSVQTAIINVNNR